ncbi:MAG: hypothetical protein AB7S26_29055 [Sandaracinaceae bacterium]
MTETRTLTRAQYHQFCLTERARPHRASSRTHLVYFLERRRLWMTARAGRGDTVLVRFYASCPCQETT